MPIEQRDYDNGLSQITCHHEQFLRSKQLESLDVTWTLLQISRGILFEIDIRHTSERKNEITTKRRNACLHET